MDKVLDQGMFEKHNKKDFVFYKNFHQIENAEEYISIFKEHNIPYLLESSETLLDSSIVGTGLIPKAIIKLLPVDFKKVNEILKDLLENYDYTNHHLNQLTEEELIENLEKPEEWTVEDQIIAKQILQGRGKEISEEELQSTKDKRLATLRKGREGNKTNMAFSFMAIILGVIIHYVFTFGGIGMALYYIYDKSTDEEGSRYHTFESTTRRYGSIMLYGGLLVLVVELLVLFRLINFVSKRSLPVF